MGSELDRSLVDDRSDSKLRSLWTTNDHVRQEKEDDDMSQLRPSDTVTIPT